MDLSGWPIVITLVFRLGLILFVLTQHPGRNTEQLFSTVDTKRYLELAASLLRGDFSTAEGPETYRLPGYPLLLAPGMQMGWPTAYALVAQSLLCCLVVVVVVWTARLIGLRDRAATAAGVLCAVEPTLLLWSLFLMADAPLGAMVAVTFLALLLHLRDGSKWTLALAAALGAGAALVKPVAYGVAFVIAFVAAWARRSENAWGALRLFLVAAFSGVLILGAWQARNLVAGGSFGFSSQFSQVSRSADFEVWRSKNPKASGEQVQKEWRNRGLDRPTAIAPWPSLASSLLTRLRLHLIGTWRTLSNPGVLAWLQFLDLEPQGNAVSREMLRKGPWAFLLQSVQGKPYVVAGSVILGGINLIYWYLFVVGFKELMPRVPAAAGAAGALILYFALASGGPWGQSRFRIPFVPALCVIAGAAFDRQVKKATRLPNGH